MTTFLVILGACGLVAMLAGGYFLLQAKWDADQRNDERNLPWDRDNGQS